MKVEKVSPYHDNRPKGEQVEEMFDTIAPAYDFMNRAMTLGIDRCWRKATVNEIASKSPSRILDLATGTGDLAIEMAFKIPAAHITGADLSENMLNQGRKKAAEKGLAERVEFVQADGTALPMPDRSFDAVTIAFGIRNFESLQNGYKEMYRVLKPGGRLLVLELSVPENRMVRPFYNFYTGCVIPFAGRMISNDKSAYGYLRDSIRAVPQRDQMLKLMEGAGFSNNSYRSFTMGVCTLYDGQRLD